MSYTVSIGSAEMESMHVSWNLNAVFRKHIKQVDGDKSEGLRRLHGKTGKEAALILFAMFDSLEKERQRLVSPYLNAENISAAVMSKEYGDNELLAALTKAGIMLGRCALFPDTICEVN